MPAQILAMVYNMADCVINISDAEGFGLATLEALACETPIIATMTGGLQEQVVSGGECFGLGIEPASKAIIGSQDVPYIYEDRLNREEFLAAIHKMYNMTDKQRQEMGSRGRAHVMKNYNFETFAKQWEQVLLGVHERCGSWDTRKGYKTWALKEIKVQND